MNAIIRENCWTVSCSENDCFFYTQSHISSSLGSCLGLNFEFTPGGILRDIRFREGQTLKSFNQENLIAYSKVAYEYALKMARNPKAIRGRNASRRT